MDVDRTINEETTQLYANLTPGDPAPWFRQRTSSNPNFAFDTIAGRYIVLCFFGSASNARGKAAIETALAHRELFDDARFSFFGVSLDPRDASENRVSESIPGIRFFWDFDGMVSRAYGAVPTDAQPVRAPVRFRPLWMVLDPTLRIMHVMPFDLGRDQAVFDYLKQLPPPERFAGVELQAPILFLPNVLEQDLCSQLIELYRARGGEDSGVMREVGGKTTLIEDREFKRRRDQDIGDSPLVREVHARINRKIVPEIRKVYCFNANRIERNIVACYSAVDGGHFRAHRDNTSKGTAHRRFAVSINLNAAFNGGEISFPEYGPRSFKPPTGGAVVFPCSLLHAVSQIFGGERYAFLPFLYDDEAAKVRKANNEFLGPGLEAYKGD